MPRSEGLLVMGLGCLIKRLTPIWFCRGLLGACIVFIMGPANTGVPSIAVDSVRGPASASVAARSEIAS